MKKLIILSLITSFHSQAGLNCAPDISFNRFLIPYSSLRVTINEAGENELYVYCNDLSYERLIAPLNLCGEIPNSINGLGLNPVDKFSYGLSPTDSLGIGAHLDLTQLLVTPGSPGDMMQADPVDIYKIGGDGGYQNIGKINPPAETPTTSPVFQVNPIVHNASSFNEAGEMFVLSYRTNYVSEANIEEYMTLQ